MAGGSDGGAARRWILALARLPDGATKELAGEVDVFHANKLYAIRVNDEFTVDVMPAIAGHSWEEMLPHVTTKLLDDVTIRLLDLPGLLKTKQGVRPKDQMDAAVIAAALKSMKQGTD